jgi:hypothetical protein
MKKGYNTTIFKFASIFLFVLLLIVLYTMKSPTVIYRRSYVQPTNRRIPINVATRGVDEYRQVGIISSNNGKVLPLYGRRTYAGSNRWNYFTQANDHLALKIPLTRNGRECDSSTGCDELYDNDHLNVREYNNDFSVKLYDTTPRYIPF